MPQYRIVWKRQFAISQCASYYKQGFSTPCRPGMCCGAGIPVPSGVSCLDQGLMVDTEYNDFQGMLNREM